MGNPLESEGAAFRWLIAVLAGAAAVILAAVLISSLAGAIVGFLLLAAVSFLIARGVIHMLGSPEGDQAGGAHDPPASEPAREDRREGT